MQRLVPKQTFFILVLAVSVPLSYACSFPIGYFYQVSNLRGTIVGVANHDLRHESRLMRQRVTQEGLLVTLREYRWPVEDKGKLRIIARTKTGKNGEFDLSNAPDGHYFLDIDTLWGGDTYTIQIVHRLQRNQSVLIDVSPVYPDCTGGHEFVIVH
ncbi:MAG: hypothetical protein P4K93_06070 [Terracidiphilus sp.]|nr:hypothetical protein [Terracidiphilus sp.]MDR3797697.1 hypothetical protein [Terracidiphilus sp.]